ncbi:MAG TPA: sarcosine oxidase subunit gamma family protein [Methylovirgula sp.]|nr:sarcosine oxidase subunit gamma family protein [Methylovirgula sp.]
MSEAIALELKSPFEASLKDAGAGDGVQVSERRNLQMATVIARAGNSDIAARLKSAFGLALLPGPKRSAANDLAFVATGPRSWLALSEASGLTPKLREALGEAAAISDQSSGYAVLRLTGPKVRATLEKGIGVDLHPRAFQPGDAASTSCAHLGVIIWQIDAAPIYEIAVFRSLADSFAHWLQESAAEFGLRVVPPR